MIPEHIRSDFPQLTPLNVEIDQLEDKLRQLRLQHQSLIDAEARKAARHKVGDEFENRSGRYRITAVTGDYYDGSSVLPQPIIWVRYKGVKLFKKGTVGRVETVRPPETA